MVDVIPLLRWGQLVVLAASLPLATIAAWGFRDAPIGRVLAALPLVSLGFLVSVTDELLGAPGTTSLSVWHVGSTVGVVAFGWLAVAFLRLVSGRRRIGG